jgi:hypothetical protein
MSNILVDDEKEFVSIVHKNSHEIQFKIGLENTKKSGFLTALISADHTIINSHTPITIMEGDLPEFTFIMRYLDFYKSLPEIEPPEHPLPRDKPINEIFEFEYVIFKEILESDDIEANIILMANVIYLANYLEMEKFYIKACAILAYKIQLISTPEERIRITNILKG